MRRLLREWWPVLVAMVWLGAVHHVAGPLAAFLAGVTGLCVALLALWEAGRRGG